MLYCYHSPCESRFEISRISPASCQIPIASCPIVIELFPFESDTFQQRPVAKKKSTRLITFQYLLQKGFLGLESLRKCVQINIYFQSNHCHNFFDWSISESKYGIFSTMYHFLASQYIFIQHYLRTAECIFSVFTYHF